MAIVAKLSHQGPRIDYTPAVAVNAGDVILQDDLFGIASVDIPANRKGALATEGVFEVLKAAVAFSAGQRAYFDVVNKVVTNDPSAGPLMGKVTQAQLSGDATARVLVDASQPSSQLMGALIAAGAALTNTTTPTALGTFNIPANRLQVGDVIRVRAQGVATATNSTDTLQAALNLNAQAIVTTAALDVANGDMFFIEADIVVRTITAAGTMVAAGIQGIGTPGTVTAKPWFLASTVLDTTVLQALKIMGTWSVANAGDSCRLDVFDVELLRQQ
jgi:predicted RecA/RadA family phage recombinase